MLKRIVPAIALVLLIGCGSGGMGDLGGVLGDVLGSSGQTDTSDVRGTVVSVDTASRRINLDVSYVNNLRDDRQNTAIYYDADTIVKYNNNQYSVTDLERGDEISIQGRNSNGQYIAQTITVTSNVRK